MRPALYPPSLSMPMRAAVAGGSVARFGASSEPPSVPARRKSPLKALWNGTLRVAPFSNLLGGLLLIASAFLPSHAATVSVNTALNNQGSAVVRSLEVPMAANSAQEDLARENLADIRDMMVRLGWILGSVGMLAGKVNVVAAGHEKKQPSMVLGGLWGMGMATVLMFDPAVPVRIAFLTASAMLINGFGNMVQNEYRLKKGEKPREFDMRPLYSKKALKKLLGPEADASSAALLREWTRQMAGMGKFVAEDHVRMVQKVGQGVRFIAMHPVQSSVKVKEQTIHLLKYLTRRTKEQPDFVKPSDTQNQVGSMLIYAGGIPWLLLNGTVAGVEQACQALIAAGSLTADLSLVGVGGAEKGINRAVAFGPLLVNGGIPWIDTNPGAGIGMVGNAFIDNYFANKANDEAQPDA